MRHIRETHRRIPDFLIGTLPPHIRQVQGKLKPKARTSICWVPNGIPGVETRLQILFSKGVVEGRITLNEFVALTSTNHAKMYGLYPKKGSIAPGFDADIVIWDPNRKKISGLVCGEL